MANVRYVCSGSCGGFVAEEDYKKGKTVCQDPNCEKNGHSLEKKLYCPECRAYFNEGETHGCK